jgi:hypothetical protein
MQRMDPTRLLQRAAEYRELARDCRTREEKADYLELASRLSTLANSDLLMPTKSSAVPLPKRRVYRFGVTATRETKRSNRKLVTSNESCIR